MQYGCLEAVKVEVSLEVINLKRFRTLAVCSCSSVSAALEEAVHF